MSSKNQKFLKVYSGFDLNSRRGCSRCRRHRSRIVGGIVVVVVVVVGVVSSVAVVGYGKWV